MGNEEIKVLITKIWGTKRLRGQDQRKKNGRTRFLQQFLFFQVVFRLRGLPQAESKEEFAWSSSPRGRAPSLTKPQLLTSTQSESVQSLHYMCTGHNITACAYTFEHVHWLLGSQSYRVSELLFSHKSCPTLWHPMVCSPPGSSVRGISQTNNDASPPPVHAFYKTDSY